MKQVKLLDCTLRDGGYVNDWEFGGEGKVWQFLKVLRLRAVWKRRRGLKSVFSDVRSVRSHFPGVYGHR